MSTMGSTIRKTKAAGFTLVELIGVMAVMAILATIVTPNILHSIEREAVKAEVQTLHTLGSSISLYLRDNAAMPTTTIPPTLPNWTSQLAAYNSLNAADILTNKRQMNRLYVIDPVAANQRAMLISSMRTGVALPTTAQISANFTAIWNTAANTVPPGAGWGAWGAGPAPAVDNIEYLVIEHVSLSSVYRTSLNTYSWSINNTSTTDTVKCVVTWANGSPATTYTLNPSTSLSLLTTPALTAIKPGDKLAFSKNPAATILFSYVVSDSGKTFTYATTTGWMAQ